MKVWLWMITIGVILYWIIALGAVYCIPKAFGRFSSNDLVSYAIQFFAGLSTFLAVIVSLFGKAIQRRMRKPELSLNISTDEDHCTFMERDLSAVDKVSKIVAIYASVCNSSETEAEEAQLVCNRAFASNDDEKFTQFATFRAASFEWLYSSDGNKYLTTLRRSVPKFIKLFEIIQYGDVRSEDGTPLAGGGNEQKLECVIDIAICLSNKNKSEENVKIPRGCRSVLLPVCLASESSPPKNFYVKLHWKGGDLSKLPTKENLELRCLDKESADRAVRVVLD